jgi:hypothetical protein
VLFIAEPAEEQRVRDLIDSGLRTDERWRVHSSAARALSAAERSLARSLASGA